MLPPSVSNLTLKHPPTCLREGGGITEAAWRRGGPSAFSRRGRSVCGSDGAWSPRRTAAPLLLHFLEEKKHRRHCCSRTLGAFFTAGPWIPLWILGLLLRNNLLLMGAEPQRRGQSSASPGDQDRVSKLRRLRLDSSATIETASLMKGIKMLLKNILNKNVHSNFPSPKSQINMI